MSFSFDVKGLDQVGFKLKKISQNLSDVGQAMGKLANDMKPPLERAIVAKAPKKTGVFASGLVVDVRGSGTDYQLFLVSRSNLLNIILKGTRPRTILPKSNGGVLVFTVGGKKVFARRVRHPGTSGNDFIAKGRAQATPELKRLIKAFKKSLIL